MSCRWLVLERKWRGASSGLNYSRFVSMDRLLEQKIGFKFWPLCQYYTLHPQQSNQRPSMHVSISRNKIRKFPASRAPTVLLFSATKNKLLTCGGGAFAIKLAKGGQIVSTHWVSGLALALYELTFDRKWLDRDFGRLESSSH